MTVEESNQVDEARLRYFERCQIFKEEVYQFFKRYKPRSHEKEKRTTD